MNEEQPVTQPIDTVVFETPHQNTPQPIPDVVVRGKEGIQVVPSKDLGINLYVTVALKDGDENVEYRQHETQHFFLGEGEAPDMRKAREEMQRALKQQRVRDALDELTRLDGLAATSDDPAKLEELRKLSSQIGMIRVDEEVVHYSNSPESAISENMEEILRRGHTSVLHPVVQDNLPTKATYFQVLGVVKTDSTAAKLISEMRDVTTHVELVTLLLQLAKELPIRHFRAIRQAATDVLNDAVRIQLGTNIHVDDYITDIPELTSHIQTNFGDGVYNLLSTEVPAIIGKALSLMLVQFDENGDKQDLLQHLMVHGVVYLPIESSDLGWGIVEGRDFGLLSKNRFPEFHAIASSILDASHTLALHDDVDHAIGPYSATVCTKDGQNIYIYRSLLGDKLIVSRKRG